MTTYQQHALSACFPAMSEADMNDLTGDIFAVGQREPIVLFEGAVLDGWHRYQACLRLELEPKTVEFVGDDPVAFVRSANWARRHLTASQRAAAIVRLREWRREGGDGSNQHRSNSVAAAAPLSAAQLAKEAGVGTSTIERAKAVERDGTPEVKAAVLDGKVSVERAAKIAKLPPQKQAAALKAPAKKRAKAATVNDELAAAREEIADLSARLKDAAEEVERLSAVEAGEHGALIKRLQAELRAANAKRDDLMRENAQLRAHVKHLQRKAA